MERNGKRKRSDEAEKGKIEMEKNNKKYNFNIKDVNISKNKLVGNRYLITNHKMKQPDVKRTDHV